MERIDKHRTLSSWVPPADIDKLCDGVGRSTPNLSARDAALIALIADVGAKTGDIVTADAADVSLRENKITLGDRTVTFCNSSTVDRLERYLSTRNSGREPLFVSRVGDRVSRRTVTAAVTDAAQSADVAPLEPTGSRLSPADTTPAALRNTAGVRMLEAGASIDAVADRLRLRTRSAKTLFAPFLPNDSNIIVV